jgi:hypothetical protein
VGGLEDDERWRTFEGDLNRQLLRLYGLQTVRVRLDSTTTSGYGTATADGLF